MKTKLTEFEYDQCFQLCQRSDTSLSDRIFLRYQASNFAINESISISDYEKIYRLFIKYDTRDEYKRFFISGCVQKFGAYVHRIEELELKEEDAEFFTVFGVKRTDDLSCELMDFPTRQSAENFLQELTQ